MTYPPTHNYWHIWKVTVTVMKNINLNYKILRDNIYLKSIYYLKN